MTISINGSEHEIAPRTTIRGYLDVGGYDAEVVIVEHNGVIVDRDRWVDITLADGDSLEIVSFVGGG